MIALENLRSQTCFLQIQIIVMGLIGRIKHSADMAAASWSSCKSMLQILQQVLLQNTVAAEYPH